MKKINIKAAIIEAIALFFVVLFLYTGADKLMEYGVFKAQIEESTFIKPFAPFVAWALPFSEFVIAVLLFFPKTRLKGLFATSIIMFVFTIYIILLSMFSSDMPCSCGGFISELSWTGHIIFNCSCIIVSVLAIIMTRKMYHRELSVPKTPFSYL